VPDVRDILREGADVEPGLPDVPELVRRGRAARRRRLAGSTAAATAVLAAAVGIGATFVPDDADVRPGPVEPATTDPVPAAAGPLAPGSYDATGLGLGVTFAVPGAGWTLTTVADGSITLRHGRTTVTVQRWDEVVDPQADPVGPADTQAVPADRIGWLTSHPRLDVGAVTQVRLGDETWTSVGVTVADPLTTTPDECNTLPCALLALSGDEPTELLVRDRVSVLVGPGPPDEDDTVVLVAQPRNGRPDAAADALVASIDPR
jgi:hypothetical protein